MTRIGDECVEARIPFEPTRRRRCRTSICCFALRAPKVMRRLWAQLAAIGVGRIMLTNAARVERNYFDTHVLDPEVYRPLLIEGLQQAQDTRLPRVTIHRRFRPLIEDEARCRCVHAGSRLVAHPAGAARAVAGCRDRARTLLAVGPEGGWDDYTSCGCWGRAASHPSASARARCAPTPPSSPCSRPSTRR